MTDASREFFRHTVATLAYRGAKTIRGAPEGFGDFRASPTSRTPSRILAHICDLLDWVLSQAQGKEAWTDSTPATWAEDSARFFAALRNLDAYLVSAEPLSSPVQQMFQGGIADALTHVGQINYLRRMYGDPVRGENYSRADISAGRVGSDQTPPRGEFD